MIEVTEDLKRMIVESAADKIAGENEDALSRQITDEIKRRIDKVFSERADALVQSAIDEATTNVFDREYTKSDRWGTQSETTSIRAEIDRLVGQYWSEMVDDFSPPACRTHHGKGLWSDFFRTDQEWDNQHRS